MKAWNRPNAPLHSDLGRMNDWQLRRSRKTPWDAIAVVAASVLVVLLMVAGVL